MAYPQIQTVLDRFLQTSLDPKQPVLLALSGGPDSMCLFHLLLTFKQRFPLDLHIAHIDHGWRPESSDEAAQLSQLVESHNLPFHAIKLYPEHMKGNIEAASRHERLKFFHDLTLQYGYQGVMTAHHIGDLAETVLQHIFEGAPLAYMTGISPINIIHGVTMWRPLLTVTKEQILEYLDSNSISYFHDKTNLDPRFMRARFRTSIIPQLTKEFGKEINTTLARIAFESLELRVFLEDRIQRFREVSVRGPFGLYIDLRGFSDLYDIEIKYLLRRIAEISNGFIPHPVADEITHLLMENAANKQVMLGESIIRVDRRVLFFVEINELPHPSERIKLKEGKFSYGEWNIEVAPHPYEQKTTSWLDLWEGKAEVVVPLGNYHLAQALPKDKLHTNKKIGEWWSDKHVPHFLRQFLPVIWQEDTIAHEFLTGRYTLKNPSKEGLKIKLSYKKKS
jgi:tRNA(Ile)-lysidine synthase